MPQNIIPRIVLQTKEINLTGGGHKRIDPRKEGFLRSIREITERERKSALYAERTFISSKPVAKDNYRLLLIAMPYYLLLPYFGFSRDFSPSLGIESLLTHSQYTFPFSLTQYRQKHREISQEASGQVLRGDIQGIGLLALVYNGNVTTTKSAAAILVAQEKLLRDLGLYLEAKRV